MTKFFSNERVIRTVFGAVFGLFAAGCEMGLRSDPAGTKTSSTDPVMTVPPSTDTSSAVLNDDPNCDLLLKYQSHNITNDGQVHYVKRVLTSNPFGSANPICVQYNDTQTG